MVAVDSRLKLKPTASRRLNCGSPRDQYDPSESSCA